MRILDGRFSNHEPIAPIYLDRGGLEPLVRGAITPVLDQAIQMA